MAKKKDKPKPTLTMLTDCTDSMIGQVNLLRLGEQLVQYITVHTETPRKCSLCPVKATEFWTVNKPFATSDGGVLLPPYALVCHRHGPAI